MSNGKYFLLCISIKRPEIEFFPLIKIKGSEKQFLQWTLFLLLAIAKNTPFMVQAWYWVTVEALRAITLVSYQLPSATTRTKPRLNFQKHKNNNQNNKKLPQSCKRPRPPLAFTNWAFSVLSASRERPSLRDWLQSVSSHRSPLHFNNALHPLKYEYICI